MAKPGDELIDSEGGRIIFRETTASSNGQLLEIEAVHPPNSDLSPEHHHPHQEERFQFLDGRIQAEEAAIYDSSYPVRNSCA